MADEIEVTEATGDELFQSAVDLFETLKLDWNKSQRGNAKAGLRVRRACIDMQKLLKDLRRYSLDFRRG